MHFKKFTLEIPCYTFWRQSVAKRSKMGRLAKAKQKLSGGERGSEKHSKMGWLKLGGKRGSEKHSKIVGTQMGTRGFL